EDVGEEAPGVDLDHTAVSAADQLVGALAFALADEARTTPVEIREQNRASVGANDVLELRQQLRLRLVDPDVDLAAARKPGAQGAPGVGRCPDSLRAVQLEWLS